LARLRQSTRGCEVTGLDRSPELLAAARELDVATGAGVRYVEALAEKLPFPDASFDVVCAGQCWHWFDRASAGVAASLPPVAAFDEDLGALLERRFPIALTVPHRVWTVIARCAAS
jgi:hypothetical protein